MPCGRTGPSGVRHESSCGRRSDRGSRHRRPARRLPGLPRRRGAGGVVARPLRSASGDRCRVRLVALADAGDGGRGRARGHRRQRGARTRHRRSPGRAAGERHPDRPVRARLPGVAALARPLIFSFAQAFYGGRHSADGVEFDEDYEAYAEARFYWRAVTAVWGAVYLVESVVKAVVVTHTSTGRALLFNRTVPWVVYAALMAWTMWWGFRLRRTKPAPLDRLSPLRWLETCRHRPRGLFAARPGGSAARGHHYRPSHRHQPRPTLAHRRLSRLGRSGLNLPHSDVGHGGRGRQRSRVPTCCECLARARQDRMPVSGWCRSPPPNPRLSFGSTGPVVWRRSSLSGSPTTSEPGSGCRCPWSRKTSRPCGRRRESRSRRSCCSADRCGRRSPSQRSPSTFRSAPTPSPRRSRRSETPWHRSSP